MMAVLADRAGPKWGRACDALRAARGSAPVYAPPMKPRLTLTLAALALLAGCPAQAAPTADAGSDLGRLDGGGVDGGGVDGGDVDAGGDVPGWLGVTHGTVKLRPTSALPSGRAVHLEAARNEWEPFQLAFDGAASGRTITSVAPSALTGPGGASIPASQLFVYAERLIDVRSPSSVEGAAGPWPDALVPAVDLLFEQPRSALPLAVPAGELRAVWIDVLVPADAAPGDWVGAVDVVSDGESARVPVTLHVFDFALPSTPTLRTTFGGPGDDPCVAHHDGPWTGTAWRACADSDPAGNGDRLTEHYRQLYMQLALEYRISLAGTYVGPRTAADLPHFDALYGGLFDGTASRHLVGSALTTFRVEFNGPPSTARAQLMSDHLRTRGWGATIFDYTKDEPESQGTCPGTGACPTITDRAAIVRAGEVRPLVTAQLRYAEPNGFASAVDILVPIINYTRPLDADYPYQPRSAYDAWLGGDPRRMLFWYQSCMSHGCGGDRGVCGNAGEDVRGFPSYVIDASAVQNRAMEWLSFTHDISGELYFDMTYALATAWDDQCAFSGAGDGTLFYPGTTERIGGMDDIPVASLRMALIREGLEDYEYLHILSTRGGDADARSIAGALFPEVDSVSARDGDEVMAARHLVAMAIEAR